MLKASDVMQTDLITVSQDTPILEAMELIVENRITGLPVVAEDMKLTGIISEKDILKIAYQVITGSYDPGPSTDKVKDFMTNDVITFRPHDNLADICQCFLDKPFRRVPVVEDGRLVGLISRKDIISFAFSKKS